MMREYSTETRSQIYNEYEIKAKFGEKVANKEKMLIKTLFHTDKTLPKCSTLKEKKIRSHWSYNMIWSFGCG